MAFGHVTWKSIGVIYLLGASTLVTSLGSFQWRGQEILSGHFFQRPEFFTLTFDHVTSKSIEVIYFQMASFVPIFGNFQAKWSREIGYWADIAWSTDWPTGAKQYTPFFQKKKKNKKKKKKKNFKFFFFNKKKFF